jgi:hypothetical protein
MMESRNGQIITFYSFKGGTGRTMALANVAWILAANGHRVLVVDWDLESPGLHRFFRPFITDSMLAGTGGVIDLIRSYESAARKASDVDPTGPGRLPHNSYARVGQHAFSIDWDWGNGGSLDFLSAGRNNHSYSRSISGLNWDDFYEVLAGGTFFDALRADMKENYDYVLIDSRTGLSDVADICTVHLPDALVTCFTLSEQGIDGAAEVARSISRKTVPRRIRVLPVMMRIDAAEKNKAETGKLVARQRFAGLPAGFTETEQDAYWTTAQVPYLAYFAYEETLATFEEERGAPGTLLAAFEALTGFLTDGQVHSLPPIDAADRARVRSQFLRMASVMDSEVTLRYDVAGTVWAEWISWVLGEAGVRVNDPGPGVTPEGAPLSVRQMVINTYAGDGGHRQQAVYGPSGQAPFVVYTSKSPGAAAEEANTTKVGAYDARTAAERLLRLVGAAPPGDDVLTGAPRFPGDESKAFQAPPQNPLFTGREAELAAVRELFLSETEAAVLVNLHGLGGIGKSQIAIEFAHRFRTAYDAVWWIDADPSADVDEQFQQLGAGMNISRESGTAEAAQAVKQALSRGEPYSRWLLIFDNAEDPARIDRLLPAGPGHVLVLSQGTAWEERARPIPVELFSRRESKLHLRSRLTSLGEADAERIAELLGDLPIAIAAAAAWLTETGMPVAEYLSAIEKGDLGVLGSEGDFARVAAAWRLSLDRLEEQLPAAYRMLEFCSVTAPEISLELIYSDAMIRLLADFDPSARQSRLTLSRLVQQIKRFALVRVDTQGEFGTQGVDRVQGGHIEIHRLLQLVVRSRMTDEKLMATRHQVHGLLTDAVRLTAEVDEPAQWPRYRILWPHVEVSKADGCSSAAVRRLLVDRVRYFFLRGNLERGLEIAEQTERVWTAMLEQQDNHELSVQLLQLRFNKANILRDKGAFLESLGLDEEVYEQQAELLGPTDEDTLMTAGSLGGDLRGLGRYAEALERDEQTHRAWIEVLYAEHPRTLTALSNLAVSHRLMGNLRRALELDQQVYDLRQAELSPNHPSTLLSGTSLGRDLREAGRFDESIALLRRIQDAYVEVMGKDSRFVVNARVNLAVSVRAAGRPEEAAVLLDAAYRQLVELVGEDHPDTRACRLSRAVNLLEMDRFAHAELEIQAVREAYEMRLGPAHPHTLVCVNNLAAATRAQGDLNEAGALARHAMDMMRQVLGPKHPYFLAAQMNLAVVEADDENYEPARELMADAADRLAEVLGVGHPHTLRCRANLAIILRRMHGVAYRVEVDAAIDAFADRVGQRHPAVAALRRDRLLRRIIDPHPF